MSSKELQIIVPASTANLGPGFDSIGLALAKYLKLKVKKHDKWEFVSSSAELKNLPNGKDHFIYKMAEKVARKYQCELPPSLVEVESDIPLARGLGSSASAIVAGIELANMLCELNLTRKDKLRLASLEEGHPDNVGASIFGGLVVGSHRDDRTDFVHINNLKIETVVIIPPYQVLTHEARNVLPSEFSFAKAVEASSISNVLIAALLTEDFALAGKMMDMDLFHQPYRVKLMPDLKAIYSLAIEHGAFGAALSGAGPTLICFTKKGHGDILAKKLKLSLPEFMVEKLDIDVNGVQGKWEICDEKKRQARG